MKTHYTVALTMLAGIGVGAVAVQGLHAQAKPPAIVVVDISDITDAEGFKAVGGRSNEAGMAVFKDLGGRYLARTQNITAIDGTPPKRFIVIAFPSVENAQTWKKSPAQKEVDAIRAKTTKSRSFIVEGM
jgi:uncharacterized protein (DUF1330 family)